MSNGAETPSPEAVAASFYRDGRTDGLPVVPPTEERVAELLRGTDLPPAHVFGTLGDREGELTVRTLAVNGVMAGCSPLHVPVLVAGARALVDPVANAIQVSTGTPSWVYQWILNGPVRTALGVGEGTPAVGPESGPTRAVGRALGLAYRNAAVVHPGEQDMGVLGNPFRYTLLLAEYEAGSPWEPLHVTSGFDPDESTLTLGGPNCYAQYATREDAGPTDVLRSMIYNTPAFVERLERPDDMVWAVHVLNPADAAILADAGLSKRDVKDYLYENSDREWYEGHTSPAEGSDDPDEGLHPLVGTDDPDPEALRILVAGGPGTENAVVGPSYQPLVTERIELPEGWDDLLAEYGS